MCLQSCKAVYDRIIDLRIATPQIIINYGMFLEENNYFEEAFKVMHVVHITAHRGQHNRQYLSNDMVIKPPLYAKVENYQ